jgi:hypothetical protein
MHAKSYLLDLSQLGYVISMIQVDCPTAAKRGGASTPAACKRQ